jgi:hypothetical protein
MPILIFLKCLVRNLLLILSLWCHCCDKKNHNTANCRAIGMCKQQKKQKDTRFEAKSGPGKKSLAYFSKTFFALKRQLKPEKTASNKKRKTEYLLPTEIKDINVTTSSDEDTREAYFSTSSKPFIPSKNIISKAVTQLLSWQ